MIVGLGNPGDHYVRTRHNAGFLVLERLAARHGAIFSADAALEARTAPLSLGGTPALLVAPQTFMNRSGRSVEAALERWPALDPEQDLVVVYDDLDLPTGRIRLRPAGGAGGHRGMRDIQAVLETRAIPRLRFGVGHPGERGQAVVDYVLAPFSEAEEDALAEALERSADAIEAIAEQGFATAMGRFNAKS
ncbi:MAG: aminoacyl-tRNA hydrolase [Myxococcota bacterium]